MEYDAQNIGRIKDKTCAPCTGASDSSMPLVQTKRYQSIDNEWPLSYFGATD